MVVITYVLFWLKQNAIAVDQLINAVCGGWADETISSRSHRWYVRKHWMMWLRYLVNGIFCWQKDHCKEAYESERAGKHLAPEMRNKKESI